jgi:hypothetical protein
MIEWIKSHPTELGLILAAIPIIISFIAGAYAAVQYIIVRKAEMFQRRFENYHELISWLVHGRGQGGIKLDNQIACVYELRSFKTYKEVSIRILEGLKKTWSNVPADKRLLDEIDITLEELRK